ncbi:CoA-transferase [Arthrobacter sp. zg-Y820]|uniref:CoA transferase subunit A n=1 Tax=unclassified Arthrobacter TaxID=235627 RepID=UPI001E50D331|nr:MULTISPECIES: CoA-transferase [unclassified Arthrobacter]MCC9196786.1 acyl CoA--acetate/3-ketoacid CoA transferase subunit alpha [Arthrobacter sp. zg-Y820]MDK1279648.1 CoA-transferase [Arthrobacter sp. zg.Y820]MDK1358731.1 CoA-transferase [Arthrobacter sp. zg-Y1219]WIB07982.1 CoA-transferase [Arthrobacter sp. zg-Y820]
MTSKVLDAEAVIEQFTDGMTIGIGGWGSRRKPMSLVRALVRSGVRDLTIVSFGGPDVGILCATGQAKRVVYGFVTLDSIAIEPHFAAARQAGAVEAVELDESLLVSGLRAAGRRLPFEATRSGLGADALAGNPHIRTVTSPYDDGEVLVAMPAIPLDLALVHLNRADELGNAQCLGPDPYFDDLFARAAARTIVSAEAVVTTAELTRNAHPSTLLLNRTMVDHVVESPLGAHFTSCLPDYGRDEAFQREYAQSASSPDAWQTFRARYLDLDDAAYRANLAGVR